MATRVDAAPSSVEYLKMIEAVIGRLAGNSFLLKGWTVTLVAGLAALGKAEADGSFALIACFVVVVFGLLDAYYLALEREYRGLYEAAVTQELQENEWSLSIGAPSPRGLWAALKSPSVFLLHGVALGAALGVLLATG